MVRRITGIGYAEDPQFGSGLARRTLKLLGFGERKAVCSTWAADHRLPIAEGGRDCGLGNYRTLCLPCHARQTRELHRRMHRVRVDDGPLGSAE